MLFKMKKNKSSERGRYVSVEKVQKLLSDLGLQLCEGRKRIHAAKRENSIVFYVSGGTVNITFQEGGAR